MNIKDIANLAGVSVSTISKVINNKAQNISPETRERILKIVKEYNYKPYDAVKNNKDTKSFVLGVFVQAEQGSSDLLMSMFKTAREFGYGTIVYASSSPEEEKKNLRLLSAQHVDGIIWERLETSELDPSVVEKELAVPVQLIDYRQPNSQSNSIINFNRLAFDACERLIQVGHRKILCYTDLSKEKRALFEAGFRKCLQQNNITFAPEMCICKEAATKDSEILLFEYTAVLCSGLPIALHIYEECINKNRRVPQQLSIIALQEEGDASHITAAEIPNRHLGEHAVRSLISVIERPTETVELMETPFILHDGDSVGLAANYVGGKIVVVGSINMDILLTMDSFPQAGKTVIANGRGTMPGGKGVNQAIGAAKLGADVCLVGKMGKDFYGSCIHDYLYKCGVNTAGVSSTAKESTGAAYISIRRDGESQIIVYDGANRRLTSHDIKKCESLFDGASFCLVQTEIHEKAVMQAVQIAKERGIKVLLKPSAMKSLPPELYQTVDILMPNEQEAAILCPDCKTVEAQAMYFIGQGVKTVIITLGNKGCYVKNEEVERYYPAAPFEAVDTTGAADAFASALAVYLSQKRSLDTAVRYATYAAGYSVTKSGVPSALIDTATLELYMSAVEQGKEEE